MENEKIKGYLKQVFDIEMAIYTHENVISDYIKKREKQAPIKPVLELPEKPKEPVYNASVKGRFVPLSTLKDTKKSGIVFLLLLGFAGILFGGLGFVSTMDQLLLGGIIFNNDEAFGTMLISFLLGVPAAIIGVYFAIKLWKKETKRVTAVNETLKNQYENQLGHYRSNVSKYKEKYEDNLAKYNAIVSTYEEETSTQLTQLNELRKTLISARDRLYSADIIYVKYRDLVSISTIYEYFVSGRCSELEGKDGAYNLYESELRSNIIIDSLGQIASDLQQIKNGQFALYREMCISNRIVTDLLCDISNNTQMTGYYAKAAAVAASADRYIVGMTW